MKRLMKNQKGLSAVVTNLIIILLVIVAVGIIWVVISNLIDQTSGDINLSSLTETLEIKKVLTEGSNVNVQVQRTSGDGNLSGIKFIVYDSNGDSQSFEEDASTMKELDTKTFSLSGYTGDEVAKVEVAPIYTTDKGQQKTLKVTDTYDLSEYAGIVSCEIDDDCTADFSELVCSNGDVYSRSHDFSCIDGSCSDSATDTLNTDCGSGSCCDASCVDTQTDENNCGSCGSSCSGGQSCISGSCEDCITACEIGMCGSGFALCSSGTTDCDTATYCGANTECSSNACQCLSNYENCDSDWNNGCEVNLQTDSSNCGSCGYDCQTEEGLTSCEAGDCIESQDITYTDTEIRDLTGNNRIAYCSGCTYKYVYAIGFCQLVKGCESAEIETLVYSTDSQKACRCNAAYGCSGDSCWSSEKYWTSITCTGC